MDYSIQLMHNWHYGAMLDDILGIKSNKISVEGKTYDLDCVNDSYWNENVNNPFPQVAEDINNKLEEWQKQYEKMMGEKNIENALDKVHEMKEKKRIIEIHMSIASYILS